MNQFTSSGALRVSVTMTMHIIARIAELYSLSSFSYTYSFDPTTFADLLIMRRGQNPLKKGNPKSWFIVLSKRNYCLQDLEALPFSDSCCGARIHVRMWWPVSFFVVVVGQWSRSLMRSGSLSETTSWTTNQGWIVGHGVVYCTNTGLQNYRRWYKEFEIAFITTSDATDEYTLHTKTPNATRVD